MEHEIRKLQAELARRQRGRGKRYTAVLKERIARVATWLHRQGRGWHAIGGLLGIPHETVRRFAGVSAPAPTFVPVEIVERTSQGLVLVSPEGYRIEGLAVADAVDLLRRLR
jgi:hypothetical protein